MDWLSLHAKLGRQMIANMHSQVYFLDADGNKHLNFDKNVKPYFTEKLNKKEIKKEE